MKILLIRKDMPIPDDFTPQLFEVSSGLFMDRCAAICMRRMLYAANSCKIKLHIISAYRSPQRQKELVSEEALADCVQTILAEHQSSSVSSEEDLRALQRKLKERKGLGV